MMRVKNEDMVLVIAGKDKGKRGTVMAVHPKDDKVVVQGVNLQTHYQKRRAANDTAAKGISKKEGMIALSNVMPVCSSCKKPCRVNTKLLADNQRVRVCNLCKQTF